MPCRTPPYAAVAASGSALTERHSSRQDSLPPLRARPEAIRLAVADDWHLRAVLWLAEGRGAGRRCEGSGRW